MYPQFPWFLFLLYGVRALNLEQVCIWSSILMHFMVLPKAARWPICSISGRYAACTICSIAVLSADPHFRFAYKVFRKLHQTYHNCEEDAILIVDQANTTWPYHAPIIILDITPWNLLWYSVEKWLQIGCYIFSKRYNEDLSTNQKYPFNSSPARSTGPPTNQPTNGHGKVLETLACLKMSWVWCCSYFWSPRTLHHVQLLISDGWWYRDVGLPERWYHAQFWLETAAAALSQASWSRW